MTSDKEFLVKGSLINGLGLVTRMLSPFLVILLARFYPQREIGLFVSFQALIYTLTRLATLGLDRGLLWNIARAERQGAGNYGLADSLMVASLLAAALFAVFALAGGFGLLGHFESLEDMSYPFILMMTASVIPMTAIQIFSSALDGKRLPQYRVFLGLFLTTSLVPLFAILLKGALGDDQSLAAGFLLGNLAGFLLFLPVIRNRFPAEPWLRPAWPAPHLVRYSIPLALSELVSGLLLRVDLWMILLLLGPEKAAVYAVMVTIANGLRSVRQTFDPLIIPIVSRMGRGELETQLKSSFSYATNMVSTIQLFIAAFIMVFPKEILSLAGKGYAIELFAFALLIVGNLANGFLGLNGQVVLGMGKGKLAMATTVSALALVLVGNWIFIPRLGIAGAALASCLGLLYQNLVQYVYIRFVRKLDLYEPHLYVNAALEIVFIAGFFLAYRRVEALPLDIRMGLFAVLALLLGGWVLVKRRFQVAKG